MSDSSRAATDPRDREWPEPPPFSPAYDKIVFRNGGTYLEPLGWWSRLKRVIAAFRPRPRNPT